MGYRPNVSGEWRVITSKFSPWGIVSGSAFTLDLFMISEAFHIILGDQGRACQAHMFCL